MQTILLVEDAAESQILVKASLSGDGLQVVCASSGAEALECLKTRTFQIILLDVNLPDTTGFELCSKIQSDKKHADVPIMFLTGMNDIPNKVTAFALGAEDFITKPFNPLELKARVSAKLNKLRKKTENEGSIRIANLHISAIHQKAYETHDTAETDLGLTTLEFKLLFHMARADGRVFTREQLLNSIWGDKVYVMDRVVDTHVCTLRKKMGASGHLVESVTGVGYCFSSARRPKLLAKKKSA